MSLFRRQQRAPMHLNTAALPDLIFTILFFFMIVTTMRTTEPTMDYTKPEGTLIEKNKRTPYTYYVYIGRMDGHHTASIVVDGQTMTPAQLADYMAAERAMMTPEERTRITVSIIADRHVEMGTINAVKNALRTTFPIRVNYSATDRK